MTCRPGTAAGDRWGLNLEKGWYAARERVAVDLG